MLTKINSIIFFTCLLSACSSINSVRPFDQQQAANLIEQDHVVTPAKQRIKIALPQKTAWKKVDLSWGTVGTPVMLIPENETRFEWTQSIRTSLQTYQSHSPISAEEFSRQELQRLQASCQQVHSTVLAHTSQSVTYRLTLVNCQQENNQVRVNKIFSGIDAVYGVSYSAVLDRISTEEIQRMTRVIQSAELVKDPRS